MTAKDRARIERAAKMAGWDETEPSEFHEYAWTWDMLDIDNGSGGCASINATTEDGAYLLAARLLGVRVSGRKRK